MCLALPGKIVAIDGDNGDIDFGGVTKRTNLSLIDAKVGDWVVIHAGFAIETMDEEEALKTIELWKEVLESEETFYG